MRIARPAFPILAAAILMGCGSSASSGADADDAEVASATSRTATGAINDVEADLEELQDYDLSMADLEKYTSAQLNMLRVSQAMPDAEEGAENDTTSEDAAAAEGDANSLSGMEARIESIPALRDAVEAAGLDAREFATIAYAYMTSAMAAGLVKSGRPVDSVSTAMKVNPDNVTFILQNEARIAPLMDRMQAEAKRLEGNQ